MAALLGSIVGEDGIGVFQGLASLNGRQTLPLGCGLPPSEPEPLPPPPSVPLPPASGLELPPIAAEPAVRVAPPELVVPPVLAVEPPLLAVEPPVAVELAMPPEPPVAGTLSEAEAASCVPGFTDVLDELHPLARLAAQKETASKTKSSDFRDWGGSSCSITPLSCLDPREAFG
jgi:hypothetical protein